MRQIGSPKLLRPRQLLQLLCALALLLTTLLAGKELLIEPPPVSPDTAQLYSNQLRHDLQREFLAAIERAQQSIHLVTYALTDRQVIAALQRKADAGVTVAVMHGQGTPRELMRQFRTNVQVINGSAEGLMHQKILVADAEEVWIGSANMTSESLRMHANLVVAFHSPLLAKLLIEHNFITAAGKGPYRFPLKRQNVEIYLMPRDGKAAVARLKACLQSAQKTVQIAMFTWTRQDLMEQTLQAMQRGVSVCVALDANAGRGTSQKIYSQLKQSGVTVGLSKGVGLLHHKMLLIDGTLLVTGSPNWTQAAFNKNDECMLVLSPLTPEQQHDLQQIWQAVEANSFD